MDWHPFQGNVVTPSSVTEGTPGGRWSHSSPEISDQQPGGIWEEKPQALGTHPWQSLGASHHSWAQGQKAATDARSLCPLVHGGNPRAARSLIQEPRPRPQAVMLPRGWLGPDTEPSSVVLTFNCTHTGRRLREGWKGPAPRTGAGG